VTNIEAAPPILDHLKRRFVISSLGGKVVDVVFG
jgi:hypothetical protein